MSEDPTVVAVQKLLDYFVKGHGPTKVFMVSALLAFIYLLQNYIAEHKRQQAAKDTQIRQQKDLDDTNEINREFQSASDEAQAKIDALLN